VGRLNGILLGAREGFSDGLLVGQLVILNEGLILCLGLVVGAT
jgi:hypothetical protein